MTIDTKAKGRGSIAYVDQSVNTVIFVRVMTTLTGTNNVRDDQ